MKILITNDDGIDSEGIRRLVSWSEKLGEVVVCAPKVQQSGKSHGIEIHEAFEIKKYDFDGKILAYSVDSTPADCVRFGVIGLKKEYDLVLSGINRGYNVGEDVIYSGTVAAAFEARALGHKAIAFSTDVAGFDFAAAELDGIYDYFCKNRLFDYADIYNVNIPCEKSKGIKITKQGDKYYHDEFVEETRDFYRAQGGCIYVRRDAPEDDTEAVLDGYVSVTPMTLDRTDRGAFEKLRSVVK